MTYDDFVEKPLPRLLERVKIDLRSQRVLFYDHGDGVQLVYRKSKYMKSDFPRYEEQLAFDLALDRSGIDLSGFGPDALTFERTLQRRGLRIEGFCLVPQSSYSPRILSFPITKKHLPSQLGCPGQSPLQQHDGDSFEPS